MTGTRIRILHRIDTGGMAEILKAEDTETHEVYAIKRILPQFESNLRFVQMFIDEAKISLLLEHPNIVRVHQFAKMDESYTIVMEYVDGINLRELLYFCNVYDYRLPLAESLYIAMEILKGLDYAHRKREVDGEKLNIIHRDLSPPNILLSLKGEVKITDFGLAKAKSQITKTVPGLIKGKFSYLAPETAYGETLDNRADLYAVGIMLWEMLSAKPLFYDEVESRILDLVRKSQIPSLLEHNPDVTPELNEIVQKSLARQREARYQSATEFYSALRNYAGDVALESTELPQIIQSLQAVENEARQKRSSAPINLFTPKPVPEVEPSSSEPESLSTLIPIDVVMEEIRKEAQRQEEQELAEQAEAMQNEESLLVRSKQEQRVRAKRARDKTDRLLSIIAFVLSILIFLALLAYFLDA
ncbi:MAG: serine/threonine protein kinase [Bradymonadia bacterium]|jgi:serine/threonine protein kinase